MTIYTVRRGDSLYTIANKYGITADALIYDNQIANPLRLVEGQALYIPVTSVSYRVKPGDSLYSIARTYNTSAEAITAANPTLSQNPRIYPGQVITIPFPNASLGNTHVNGFSVKASETALRESYPALTYVSLFSWQADTSGGITPVNDQQLAKNARAAHTAPLMSVTNIRPGGGFSSDIAHTLLTDETAQNALLTNILAASRQRNYYGVIFDIEYIYPYDRESYNQFLRRAVPMLHAAGLIVMTAIAPKTSATQVGTLYQAHDYQVHGEVVDFVIIMTYEWGYIYGPAMAVAPVNEVRRVLDYAVTAIPPKKILMGMPNYGYDWTLPFTEGSSAKTLSNTAAITQASNVGAVIKYDEASQAPFYNYYDRQGKRHEVWFDDARSIRARLRLINEYGLGGLSYWTVDNLFRTQFLVLQSMYNVVKVV